MNASEPGAPGVPAPLPALENRRIVLAQVIMGRAPLAPRFGNPRRTVDELRREARRFRMLPFVIQVTDRAQHLLLLTRSHAAPQLANARFGNRPHPAITIH